MRQPRSLPTKTQALGAPVAHTDDRVKPATLGLASNAPLAGSGGREISKDQLLNDRMKLNMGDKNLVTNADIDAGNKTEAMHVITQGKELLYPPGFIRHH